MQVPQKSVLPLQKKAKPCTAFWGFCLFAILFGLGLGTPAQATEAQQKVVLQLKWRHQFQFAGYYAAIQKGYYRDVGLEVTLCEAQQGVDPAQEVLAGHADYGVGTSELVLQRAQGMPLVLLAPIFQHSPLILLTRADTGISSIEDLPGHPLMLEPQSAQLLAYFAEEGVPRQKLSYQSHSFDLKDLLQGHVHGISAYATDEPYLLRQAGIPYHQFTPRAVGMDFYGDSLFTTQKQVREHPEQVQRFREASLKGWRYALRHPQERQCFFA